MTHINHLTSDLLTFIETTKDKPFPPLLDPTLQNITNILNDFQQGNYCETHIKNLTKYCLFYANEQLAEQLLNWAIQSQPNQYQYYYFQAIIHFKQKNIPATFSAIEKMLHSMKASDTQIKHILQRLHDTNKQNDSIFFIDSILKEFNLPQTEKDFNIFILPYDIKGKDNIIQYYYSIYFIQLCNTLRWTEQGQLEKLLAAESNLNGLSPWYHLCMGKLYWILNNREQTDFHFKKAKELSIEQKILFSTGDCGVYTWLSDQEAKNLENIQENQDPFELELWQWSYADLNEEKPDISIILGCDFKYFKYFPKFLFSLLKAHIKNNYTEKTVISICLDNPSINQIRFLRETSEYIHQHIPNFYLTFGYGLCPYQDGAYFASIRYLFAPELFELYPAPTFIVDIDAYAYEDFFMKTKDLKEHFDFALRIFAFDAKGNQTSGEPWCLGAGILYLGDMEKTKHILSLLKQYVNYAYNPSNPINWCIDQCALVQAFDYYIRPFWDKLRIMDIDHNPPFLLSHIIGEKDEFYRHNGVIDIDNFQENLQQLIM